MDVKNVQIAIMVLVGKIVAQAQVVQGKEQCGDGQKMSRT